MDGKGSVLRMNKSPLDKKEKVTETLNRLKETCNKQEVASYPLARVASSSSLPSNWLTESKMKYYFVRTANKTLNIQ